MQGFFNFTNGKIRPLRGRKYSTNIFYIFGCNLEKAVLYLFRGDPS